MDALFSAHAGAVYAFARRRSSQAVAEDIVSDTFLVAWRRLDQVPEQSLPWLLGVARKALANSRRADARQAALRLRMRSDERGIAPHGACDIPPTEQVPTATILAGLDALPPAERDAITLIAWEGMTPDEAAVILGCSRATLYVRVHRAKRRLTVLMQDTPLRDTEDT